MRTGKNSENKKVLFNKLPQDFIIEIGGTL